MQLIDSKIDSKVINLREIHPTAIVHPNAKIGRNVVIGPMR